MDQVEATEELRPIPGFLQESWYDKKPSRGLEEECSGIVWASGPRIPMFQSAPILIESLPSGNICSKKIILKRRS